MRAFVVAAALSILLAAAPGFAQAPAAAPAPAPQAAPAQPPFPAGARYAFINIQRIAAESAQGKALSSRVQTLNGMIPGWATQNNTAQSPVTVVDQYTNFNTSTDTGDGVHANPAGSMKIATNWFNALIPIY